MDSFPQIRCFPRGLAPISTSSGETMPEETTPNDYVLSDTIAVTSTVAVTHDDQVVLVSKLNSIAAQYAQFFRSIAPCVLASCHDLVSRSKAAALSRAGDPSRLSLEKAKLANVAFPSKTAAAGATPGPANCVPPDLESFWSATSPLPPTAVLTALYGLLPVRHVSTLRKERETRSSAETNVDGEGDEAAPAHGITTSVETLWTLCRSAEALEKDGRKVSFWESYAMTVMAVHSAAGKVAYSGSTGSSQGPTSSASSFSLAHQLSRATAVLTSIQRTGAPAPILSGATTLLEWPEDFLWNLLVSLLSALTLVHSAGLHFFGQLTASNVLCLSCTSSLPRLLEQTWQDVVAATGQQQQQHEVDGKTDSVTLFRRFYSVASRSLLLPQASLTPETLCYNAFFVVQPSIELLSRGQAREGADTAHIDQREGASLSSAAQEAVNETPEQQARYQASDLASVGHLLKTIMDVRAQWVKERGPRSFLSSAGASAPVTSAAQPSSELVFLVRRLCECASAAQSVTPQRSYPAALQLLQLQALRLRTESWYYRRLAAEAYDRLAQVQQAQQIADVPVKPCGTHMAKEDIAQAERKQAGGGAEARLQAREAAVAEREAKLDLILRVYELTHEHLDAVNLPKPQTPSPQRSGAPRHTDPQNDESLHLSPTPRDDSLEALLSAPVYSQAATTTTPAQASASLSSETFRVPIMNVSHQQKSGVPTAVTADVSEDALWSLSPLTRAPEAEDADVTLFSANATPLYPLHDRAQSTNQQAISALPWHKSATHRTLDVIGPSWPPLAVVAKKGKAEDAPPATTRWPETAVRRSPQPQAAGTADARVSDPHTLGEAPQLLPWDPSQIKQQRQKQDQLLDGERDPRNTQKWHNGCGISASAPPHVTVVEVELDDNSDTEDIVESQQATAFVSGPTQGWPSRMKAEDPQLAPSPHPRPQPQTTAPQSQPLCFPTSSSPHHTAPTTRVAQDMQTPVRAPALPNMGTADVDVSGAGGAAGSGGGGGSHMKYSFVSQLRTPPSARRLAAGSRRIKASSSPSPHSPESYRSSTKPYATTAAAGAAPTYTTGMEVAVQPRSSRRRSGSRGSSANHPNRRHHSASADGANSSVASAANRGAASGTSGGNTANENGEWARQQLTELQNMQTALRAQQPATPRSRASASAPTTAGGAGEQKTPELRRAHSPASSSSPPVRPGEVAVMSTPPSPSQQMTTPTRNSANGERSTVGTGSIHRAPHASYPPPDQVPHYHGRGMSQENEPPVRVQGTLWATTVAAAGTNVIRTPLSSRQWHEEASSTLATLSSAAPRSTPVLSGRATPPGKPTNPNVGPCVRNSVHTGAVGSERSRFDMHGFPSFHSSAANTTAAAVSAHATTTTAATAAALGAALRTPPRQTVPTTVAIDHSDYHTLANLYYTANAPPLPSTTISTHSSAKRGDTAISVINSAHTFVASAEGRAAASLRSASRSTQATTPTTALLGAVRKEVSPRRSNGSAASSSACAHSSSGDTKTKFNAPLRRSCVEMNPPTSLSSSSPSNGFTPSLAEGTRKSAPQPRGAASSTSAMELLRRLRASSTATAS